MRVDIGTGLGQAGLEMFLYCDQRQGLGRSYDLVLCPASPERRGLDMPDDAQAIFGPAQKHEKPLPGCPQVGRVLRFNRNGIRMPIRPLEHRRSLVHTQVAPEAGVIVGSSLGVQRQVGSKVVHSR